MIHRVDNDALIYLDTEALKVISQFGWSALIQSMIDYVNSSTCVDVASKNDHSILEKQAEI